MKNIQLFVVAAGVGAVVTALPSASQAQEPHRYLKHLIEATETKPAEEDLKDHDGLETTIARIGNAMERENEGDLEKLTVSRKIYLALSTRSEEAGYYGRSQIKFMFGKLFHERQTRAFTYDSRDIEIASEDTVFFRAEWTYVVLDEDDIVTESLRFKLERTGDEWRVAEIRAAAR